MVRLVSRSAETERAGALAPIPVPAALEPAHEVVRALKDDLPELIDAEGEARQRALLILQAIADECSRRSYEFGLRPEQKPTFRISVGDVDLDFSMFEEFERRSVVNEDELEEVKYSWQRVRSTVQQVRSGKLVLRTGSDYSPT